MATYTWTRSRQEVRDMALRKLGVLAAGQTPAAEDTVVVFEAMDARLKEMHALGTLWWNVGGAATNLTLTAGQSTATIAASDYLFPVSLMLTVGTDQQPIDIIGHSEYQALTNKTDQGEPVKAFFSGSTVYLWPVPQTTTTAQLTYQAIAADGESTNAPDVRVEALRAFSVIVAADLIDDFATPEPKASRLLAQQMQALRTIRALNQQHVGAGTVTPTWY